MTGKVKLQIYTKIVGFQVVYSFTSRHIERLSNQAFTGILHKFQACCVLQSPKLQKIAVTDDKHPADSANIKHNDQAELKEHTTNTAQDDKTSDSISKHKKATLKDKTNTTTDDKHPADSA